MTMDTDQKYQWNFEPAANMLCELKQRDNVNKGYGKMSIPAAEEVLNVSSYLII